MCASPSISHYSALLQEAKGVSMSSCFAFWMTHPKEEHGCARLVAEEKYTAILALHNMFPQDLEKLPGLWRVSDHMAQVTQLVFWLRISWTQSSFNEEAIVSFALSHQRESFDQSRILWQRIHEPLKHGR